jgi:hypothetical protein
VVRSFLRRVRRKAMATRLSSLVGTWLSHVSEQSRSTLVGWSSYLVMYNASLHLPSPKKYPQARRWKVPRWRGPTVAALVNVNLAERAGSRDLLPPARATPLEPTLVPASPASTTTPFQLPSTSLPRPSPCKRPLSRERSTPLALPLVSSIASALIIH